MSLLQWLSWVVFAFMAMTLAQNDSLPIDPCCNIDPGVVPSDQKDDWCKAEKNTCSILCSSSPLVNECDNTTLSYGCMCPGGIEPNMANFLQTVPGQMCRWWFDECINATADNLSQQFQCDQQREGHCGNYTVKPIVSVNSSSTTVATSRASASATISDSNSSSQPLATSATTSSAPVEPSSRHETEMSKGAVAGTSVGAVIGGIAAIAIIGFLCMRRRKRQKEKSEAAGAFGPGSYKEQDAFHSASGIPHRSELHGDGMVHELNTSSGYPDYSVAGSRAPPPQAPSELYSHDPYRNTELQGSMHRPPAVPESASQSQEVEETRSISPASPPPAQTYQSPPLSNSDQSKPSSAGATALSVRGLSPEQIMALEEEERQIDIRIEELRRMKELQDQKFAIQQKLREAKNR